MTTKVIENELISEMLKKDEEFKIEVDKTIKFIEAEYLNYFQILFNEVCGKTRKNKLNLRIDWKSFYNLSYESGMCCVEILQNIETWIFFNRGLSRYLNDPDQRSLFNEIIKEIVYCFREKEKSQIKYQNGKLYYVINSSLEMYEENESILSLNMIYYKILKEFQIFFYEEEESDDDEILNDIESIMSSGNDLMDLKKLNRTDRPLYFLVQMIRISKQFWIPNKTQTLMIELCKKELPMSETFIRGWVITKINSNYMFQERVFILTDKKFYTFHCDGSEYKDFRLDEFILCDIGRFVEQISKKDKNKKGKLLPFGLAVYTTEDSSNHTLKNLKEKKNQSIKSVGDVKRFVKGKKKKLKNIQQEGRPEYLNDLRVHYFGAPQTIYQSEDHYSFLLEVGWCIYTCAIQIKKDSLDEIYEPYENWEIEKPKGDVGSLIYNKLKLGKNKNE
eukprot:gene11498-4662_t